MFEFIRLEMFFASENSSILQNIFPQAPVGNFYVNSFDLLNKI